MLLYIFWFLHQTTTMQKYTTNVLQLYIFWFLHQTTTWLGLDSYSCCCISFDSYIKPQLVTFNVHLLQVVYLLIPTSNHNHGVTLVGCHSVVYLLIPTSNHNSFIGRNLRDGLYIFWFLHQTTTVRIACVGACKLYIFWFLHQTTTYFGMMIYENRLYIFWFLHQTTT